jgi:hypothetical protein
MLVASCKLALGSQIARGAKICGKLGEEAVRIEKLVAALLLLGAPGLALAHRPALAIPEPETLALIAGGAVAWAIVRWTRRK